MNSRKDKANSGQKVSVIIVNWNGKRFLERLLISLEVQTYERVEVILVDNSSLDGSADYVKSEFPNVILLNSENLGFGHACNVGAEKASGDFLIFLNEDTYLPKNFVSKMIEYFLEQSKACSNIGAIGCKFVGFDQDPEAAPITYGGQIDLFGYPINKYNVKDIFSLAGIPFFCSRKIYLEVGGYSEFIFLFGEEVELSWRMRLFGYKLLTNPDTYLHHFSGGVTGGFNPRKVALVFISSVIPMINCYSVPLLLLVLPLYVLYITAGLAFLTIYKGFKLDVVREYFKCLNSILKHLPGILKFRRFIQKNRVISDIQILKYISVIPSFIYNQWWFKLSKDARYEIK